MQWFFLVGFMGVGKTTLGSEVAERMSLPFFDLDDAIARAAGRSIPKIFEMEGEHRFRDRETAALRELLESRSAGIVATGGGAFTREENRKIMSEAGISVWLDAPVDAVVERVRASGRPLATSEAQVRVLAERRKRYYRLANHRLELGTDSVTENAARLYRLLAPYRGNS